MTLPSLSAAARPLDRRRQEFPSLDTGIYLMNHSQGPVPRGAAASMQEYVRLWEGHGRANAWDARWWRICDEVADRVAALLGAVPGSVQMQPNASVALSSVLSCFDLGGEGAGGPSTGASPGPPAGRRRIVTSALDFTTTGYILGRQREVGAEIEVVPSDDGIVVPEARLVDAIDERTALVVLSHVTYCSSHRLDPAPIIEKAHRVGALVLLDVYQSAGVVEIDATGWGVDFLIGGTIKWLCGGPAAGYLYVREDLRPALAPRLTGWIAHEKPLDFVSGPIRYAASAWRFAQGTPNIPAMYSCLPGLQIISEVGVASIAAESRRRTQWMIDVARENGWTVNSPTDALQRGGVVMIGVNDPKGMVRQLAAAGVSVDCRPSAGLRISPHFFTEDGEVESAMEILAELLGG
ncbi:MAG: aminotransferase class V-fold PLP-dependent enzyme [Acidobacteriota bacterium]